MSAKNAIRITLDREINSPGNTISGIVGLLIGESPETNSGGLFLTVKGVCNGSWDSPKTLPWSSSDEHDKTYDEEEIIFTHTDVLLEGGENEIPIGYQGFQFQYQLPPNAPSSINARFASINYEIEARLVLPQSYDLVAKRVFTVIRVEDLNARPELRNPETQVITKNFGSSIKGQPLTLKVTIPKSGFALEEDIKLSIEYSNSSGANVLRTRVKLIKYERYKCVTEHKELTGFKSVLGHGIVGGHRSGESKFFVKNVATSSAEGCKGNFKKTFIHTIQVPPNLPVSTGKTSRMYQVYYELKVTADLIWPILWRKVSMTFPITIGEVSISDPSFFNFFLR